MAHQEAIRLTSERMNVFFREEGKELSFGDFLRAANLAAVIINTQAEHLEVSSTALQDQALDTLIEIKKKLTIYG